MNSEIDNFDNTPHWNQIWVPVLLHVSFFWISVTKLWDIIIRQWVCNSQTGNGTALDSKSSWGITNKLDTILPVKVKCGHKSWIRDTIYKQNLSEWRHSSHKWSDYCVIWTWMNDSRHVALMHASNYITLPSNMVHMVEFLVFAYGTSWNSRRRSWIWKGEEVRLYKSKTSGLIYMPLIGSRKHRDTMSLRQSLFRYCV